MANLTRAHQELFRRSPDETYSSVQALWDFCYHLKDSSVDRWASPTEMSAVLNGDVLTMRLGADGAYEMNDWSFTQLCRLADVNKDTVNRLSPRIASSVFAETLPQGNKPMQILTQDNRVRSIHGTVYTRLWNVDLLNVIREFGTDFQPPQTAVTGGTGLYAGEQDMFCFLIDPLGWVEVEGENYAPGFFVWNSEVGRRALGIQTFWFQAVCQNHIVWDAIDVCEFTTRHTSKVNEGLAQIRRLIEEIARKRDERKDRFSQVIRKAMTEKLGSDAEEALKTLCKNGIPRAAATAALEEAKKRGRFTIWALIDVLTRMSQSLRYAGDRIEADAKASALLALAV
jgi:hypothetical protein